MQAEKIDLPGPCKGKFAMVIRNVLSPEECQELIARTEQAGYVEAMVNVGGGKEMLLSDYRNSQRCIIDDIDYAALLKIRIESHLPVEFKNRRGAFDLVGLNERLRFLKYTNGNFFAPHCDGSYVRDDGECSFITLMLYLNSGATGGETRIFNKVNENQYIDVVPEPGMVLLFQHDILHEGVLVVDGTKYAMRTDVMYRPR